MPSGGAIPKGIPGGAVTTLDYATTDCSGPAYWSVGSLVTNPGVFGSVLYYVPAGPGEDVTIQSRAQIDPDGTPAECVTLDVPFSASGSGEVVAAAVPVVVPPVHVEP